MMDIYASLSAVTSTAQWFSRPGKLRRLEKDFPSGSLLRIRQGSSQRHDSRDRATNSKTRGCSWKLGSVKKTGIN